MDPYAPSREELRAWAYGDHDGMWPVEDWDVIVASEDDADLYFDLVADRACPHRDTFLHFLHLLVGEHFRGDPPYALPPRLRELIDRAESAGEETLRTWARRARALERDPSRFDYDDWCGGGLAFRSS